MPSEAAKLGPVDAFASSGGAMCALHWVVAHPEDVRTLVAHEPPLFALLEDAEMAIQVTADIVETGGFAATPWSPNNDPAAFATKLRELFDE